ncbi:hypothetical protein ASPZODRAFT_67367 [Penicilliopsis zonata CBS 506.65]|uniref:Threonine/serine exporter-like N-terminal domain-containing protein n=1 Tax=Penicilliopsis zonata CBS 506.65 TaxID=1073090 RepID=A0A1L9SG30_9EURO|nr:hypothetical protein ASPZODRAFT_67367 [Penicilliopsis zonata CBS 506.65]OJJ46073.1 hypothetical protein ASPZODRAFT_67367 [Penicilliopsis zonata CBS 506.65]
MRAAHSEASDAAPNELAPIGSKEKQALHHSMSTRDRWRNVTELLKERTARAAERLGRPPEEGDALDAAFSPEYLGATDDLYAMRQGRLHNDETRSPHHQHTASSEAALLVERLGLTQNAEVRQRKASAASQHAGTRHADDSLASSTGLAGLSSSTPGGGGILSQLLKLQAGQLNDSYESLTATDSESETPSVSGKSTPLAPSRATTITNTTSETGGTSTPGREKLRWYNKSRPHSTASLLHASMDLTRVAMPVAQDFAPGAKNYRASLPADKDGQKKRKKKKKRNAEVKVTVHIAEILNRQRYIMQLCRALMRYGAPTHRLEEYMQMTARVLEVDGQFLYLPGCMIMSFDDAYTRTAEVKLVRVIQGIDLGRLAETHNIYKNVVHDLISVNQAIDELNELMGRAPRRNKWILVGLYGLASAAVGPFAFEARPIDMPIICFLGCLVGFMQHVIAPHSVLYSNVFEVSVAIITSFLSRAFGSIKSKDTPFAQDGEYIFCYAALTQSSIALILPGFSVLSSSLELQSHQMIAGSIRLVYTIIYSLFLGYGVTVGTTIYGLMDSDATTQTSCKALTVWGDGYQYVRRFPFVAVYCLLAALINQGKWKSTPVMVVIGVCGYVANYFSSLRLGSTNGVANTVGAFTIGFLGNLYSRIWHGHAATAILPGIFVLVPSGLASSGSIISGMEYANEVKNGSASSSSSSGNSLTSLGFSMIQIAIGITVGLFISALIVYPYGKRRSGLFSF